MTPRKKAKITQIGRLIVTIQWDWKGHWIRNANDHHFHCWLHFGPCRHPKGLISHNLIVGPLGIAAAWEKKPSAEDPDTTGLDELIPEEPKA